MDMQKLIKQIEGGNRGGFLFHFTDTRNIPSIALHGILSRLELAQRKIEDVVIGGNQWSLDQDERMGVSDYVHLCFFSSHPMEYHAKKEGRIEHSYFIKVLPSVLNRPGVKFCAGVANAADAELLDVEDFGGRMDMEVLFKRTDWRDPAVQARLQIAKKYEVLVPKRVLKHT